MKVQSLQILAERLIERGFLVSTQALSTQQSAEGRVIEVGDTSALPIDSPMENSANFYLALIRHSRFSWMLFDGSLVQIKYTLKVNDIVAHRYCYIPAPFTFDLREERSQESLTDIIEAISARDPMGQARRSTLRFEYDPGARALDHPAAHLHINHPICRIPVRSSISVREFVAFLLRFFYADRFDHSALARPSFSQQMTLSDEEEESFHLGWRTA
jgi:hypothetical protein